MSLFSHMQKTKQKKKRFSHDAAQFIIHSVILELTPVQFVGSLFNVTIRFLVLCYIHVLSRCFSNFKRKILNKELPSK